MTTNKLCYNSSDTHTHCLELLCNHLQNTSNCKLIVISMAWGSIRLLGRIRLGQSFLSSTNKFKLDDMLLRESLLSKEESCS